MIMRQLKKPKFLFPLYSFSLNEYHQYYSYLLYLCFFILFIGVYISFSNFDNFFQLLEVYSKNLNKKTLYFSKYNRYDRRYVYFKIKTKNFRNKVCWKEFNEKIKLRFNSLKRLSNFIAFFDKLWFVLSNIYIEFFFKLWLRFFEATFSVVFISIWFFISLDVLGYILFVCFWIYNLFHYAFHREKQKMMRHLFFIVRRLEKNGYTCFISKNISYLFQSIVEFKVENQFGYIVFQKVNIRKIERNFQIIISKGYVSVENSEELENCSAFVCLKDISEDVQNLKKVCSDQGSFFFSYYNREWIFFVEHFSSYGIIPNLGNNTSSLLNNGSNSENSSSMESNDNSSVGNKSSSMDKKSTNRNGKRPKRKRKRKKKKVKKKRISKEHKKKLSQNLEKARKVKKKQSEKTVSLPPNVKGLDGKYWKSNQNNRVLIECEEFFGVFLDRVICKYCHNIVKYKESSSSGGFNNKIKFGCNTAGCRNQSFFVFSGQKVKVDGYKNKISQVNIQVVAAQLMTGINKSQLDLFCGALGLNPLSKDTHSKLSRMVGKVISRFLQKNEDKWLAKERELTLKMGKDLSGLYIIVDGTWSKRGKGYNSDVGMVPAVGHFTKKVIAHHIMSKRCAVCESAEKNNKKPKKHKCGRNFDPQNSSGSMEPLGTVEIIKKLDKRSPLKVTDIGGDNDSTVISTLRKSFPGRLFTKHAGISHLKKNAKSWLKDLKKRSFKSQKSILTNLQINSIVDVYLHAVFSQNKGNKEEMISSLKGLLEHIFGNHENCGSWCKNDVDEKHHLRFEGDQLKNAINTCLIQKLIRNIDQVVEFCSDNNVEAVQNSIHTTNPKKNNASKTELYKERSEAGLIRYNEGAGKSIPNLMQELHIPHNNLNQLFFKRKTVDEKYQSSHKRTVHQKRSRTTLVKSKSKKKLQSKTKKVHVAQYVKQIGYGSSFTDGIETLNESSLMDNHLQLLGWEFWNEKDFLSFVTVIKNQFKLNDYLQFIAANTWEMDFETTSLDTGIAIPVEIAAKPLVWNYVFSDVANPFGCMEFGIPQVSTDYYNSLGVHKYTERQLSEGKNVKTLFKVVYNIFKKLEFPIVIAWNCSYEERVWKEMEIRCELDPLPINWVEGRYCCKKSIIALGRSLGNVFVKSKIFEIEEPPKEAHKGYFDVFMMDMLIFKKRMKKVLRNIGGLVKRKKVFGEYKWCGCKSIDSCSNCSCSRKGLPCSFKCKCTSCANRKKLSTPDLLGRNSTRIQNFLEKKNNQETEKKQNLENDTINFDFDEEIESNESSLRDKDRIILPVKRKRKFNVITSSQDLLDFQEESSSRDKKKRKLVRYEKNWEINLTDPDEEEFEVLEVDEILNDLSPNVDVPISITIPPLNEMDDWMNNPENNDFVYNKDDTNFMMNYSDYYNGEGI